LAEAVVAETMAAHQQDRGRKLVVNGSLRLSAGAGRHCAVSLAKASSDRGHNAAELRQANVTAGIDTAGSPRQLWLSAASSPS
jgi:hypothetical protein